MTDDTDRAPEHDAGGSGAATPPPQDSFTILVVRHAESVANAGAYFASQADSPLTDRGREQALSLAHALEPLAINAIYSSDLSRAVETVLPVAAARGLNIVRSELLRERAMGELTGRSFDDTRQSYPDLWKRLVARDPHVVPPGGESHAHVAQRAQRFVEQMLGVHSQGTVLLVSHGGMIHHVLRTLIGINDVTSPIWFSVANASVSRVDFSEIEPGHRGARLTYVNRVVPRAGERVAL